jgi:hypothetical protein
MLSSESKQIGRQEDDVFPSLLELKDKMNEDTKEDNC